MLKVSLLQIQVVVELKSRTNMNATIPGGPKCPKQKRGELCEGATISSICSGSVRCMFVIIVYGAVPVSH